MRLRLLHIVLANQLALFALLSPAYCHEDSTSTSLPDSAHTTTPDSLKQHIYAFDEVVVTAIRASLSKLDSPSRVKTIHPEEIHYSAEKNLGELLDGKTGQFVRHYGVGTSLQTVSFRGMSAEHSVVLLDGIPIGNVQTGLTDLSLIPLESVESIELMRGGSSSQYGSDALGGVINVLTNSAVKSSLVKLDASTGSVGVRYMSIVGQAPISEEIGLRLGSAVEYGRGDFSFTIRDGTSSINAVRSGSDFRSRRFFAKGSWSPVGRTQASLLISSVNSTRGTPGPVLSVSNQGTARQTDDMLQAAGSLQTQLNEELRMSVAVDFQNAYERYVNNDGVFRADNNYRNTLARLQSSFQYALLPNVVLHPGIEFGYATATGNALPNEKSRLHSAAYLGSELHFVLNPLRISAYPSLRYDKYSTIGTAVSPKIGLNVRYPGHESGSVTAILHSTIGGNFRAATFNELYYSGSGGRGNSDLHPERSTSVDAGLTMHYSLFGLHECDLMYYSITTEDRIQWLPTSVATIWSPANIGRTRSSGIEFEYHWSPLPGFLTLEGNYSTIDAQKKYRTSPNDQTFNKQLIYVPLETGFVATHLKLPVDGEGLSNVFFRLEDMYVGSRYIAEDNSQALPPYNIMNVSVRVEMPVFGMTAAIKYEMMNVLDQSYEILPRYPMPLRNASLSLSITNSF